MLAVKYALFAVVSTGFNLIVQYLSFQFYTGSGSLYAAMFSGTLAGLLSKYILDKKYIFYHRVKGKRDDFRKFMLYSCMGVFTTMIFWGTEAGFDALFAGDKAKYVGAVIGLTIGYLIKYFLDKKFVFIHREVGV